MFNHDLRAVFVYLCGGDRGEVWCRVGGGGACIEEKRKGVREGGV